ncbi:hydroxyacylglutathione hydrolase [Coprinopsis cinerea okayama7|uniref:hydroxyacylglutathione hydrolase n=1 Tax=Coprinopsis cinerea (strain Okayama-7 / 130 / ATCC MYA-4618 / FGSC 9003) TaxID=240176 RepID=A8NFY0_COPC7|nr:hydroxyacylglutathione hydrolase [Coprinopsis cinerea okayama7\|eukprot:XP_001833425.2 hydroxyacylglutathione hydrolase [Coprinopsis cinerea okayama7\
MKIVPVPVREDNYAYLLIDEPSNKAAAVDIYDVPKVTEKAKELGVEIVAAITTHHHYDHAGGNKAFAQLYPGAPIYGGSDQVAAVNKIVKDNETFTFGDNITVRCLATPCHTRDSICFHVTDAVNKNHPGGVFTGDTLFIGGCGRFFEGSAEEMVQALNYLRTLPDETIVYNGHEYTASNLAFGKHIEPDSPGIEKLTELVEKNKITTGLTTIGDEKRWNVFMRLGVEAVRKATSANDDTPDAVVMDSLRNQKNTYKG